MNNLKYGDKISHIAEVWQGRSGYRTSLITSYFVKYINADNFYYMPDKDTPQFVSINSTNNIVTKAE